MTRFETILVPVDFSDHSKEALDTAIQIAPLFLSSTVAGVVRPLPPVASPTSPTLSLDGTWYEGVFSGASYAVKLADGSDLLGVFRVDTDALLLLGVVSPDAGFDRTELTYDPPAVTLDLPLSEGKSWSSLSTVWTAVTRPEMTWRSVMRRSKARTSGGPSSAWTSLRAVSGMA